MRGGWLIFVGCLSLAGRLPALQDDGRVVTPGEVEEGPEMIPEESIPYHDSLVELPEWMKLEQDEVETRQRPANQGGGLFPGELWALQPEAPLAPLKLEEEPPERPAVPAVPDQVTLLTPELLALYAPVQGAVFVDPQGLVQERSGGRMGSLVQRWLNDQCAFRTTVLVFGPGQQLPADFDPQALRRKWFGEEADSLLVFYFYQQPERTLTIFGPGARSQYADGVLRSMVDAAVTEAGRISGGAEQLERFCYKMSVRLHWLARTGPPGEAVAAAEPAAAGSGWTKRLVRPLVWSLSGAALVCGLLKGWQRWRRYRASRPEPAEDQAVWLPEGEIAPRLGAPHGGGFSSVITFTRMAP
jgi:hypothetical protein